ncbi:MAG TPA: VWA domain-containing protein [Gammaproteobacteria bacterium]|nr:VWA domain-containing protein [Gammaproteobacteria bacterium]
MKKTTHKLHAFLIGLLYVLSAGHPLLADDTEVLIGPGGQAWAKPNVLFIMDTSGSMRTIDDANVDPRSRLKIVQAVFRDLMNTNSGFNVALMRFSQNGLGGYFVSPMQELNSSTRSSIIAASDAFTAQGDTPLSETLYEAARYWGGLSVDFGDSSTPRTNVTGVATGGTYISPISSQCQRNFTILLTDGEPNGDNDADSRIATLTGNGCTDNCLDEVAEYLHTADQNTTINGTQMVDTYTIGFTTDQTLLQDTATKGGGTYITANNASELSNAFASILDTITDTNDTFSPPALALNDFSGVSHFNKLYFALFEPAAAPKWDGNVKPYTLNDNFQLVDADGNPAVDARNMFVETSRSLWSNSADGASIVEGGANGQLPAAAARNLYTYTGGYQLDGLTPTDPAISADNNALRNSVSSDLTAADLGITGTDSAVVDAQFTSVIDAVRSFPIGAPLHTQPTLVTYGGTETSPDMTLFVATNNGFLHALNAASGVEQFAFIPKELLPNLPTLASPTGNHPYGLDGDISVWVKESSDLDRDIEASEGDHVYVYVGMRRGGNNYYALDVTDRDNPTLKWVIRGGPGGTPGFEELGQTWSKPTLTTVKYGSGSKKVLIFAGGYDTAQDANPLDADDSIGRAIFIVDADTGERLWWAGPTGSGADLEMSTLTNSIPSDVRLLDSNLDGKADRVYVGDMRGQIFRFDLAASASGITGSGIRLASLGGIEEVDNRRFYYPPDVVVTQRRGEAPYVSINIGSGYRAHPLNPVDNRGNALPRVNDRFYSLRDPYVVGPIPASASVTTITNTSLFDATNSLVTSNADISALDASSGWYLTLGAGSGEKVLAPAMTINGEIFFTTYTPPASVAASECAPPPGTGRLYRVSLFDASPVQNPGSLNDPNNPPTPSVNDRAETLERPGIPSAPTAIFRENSNGDIDLVHCEGADCDVVDDGVRIQPTYWKEEL